MTAGMLIATMFVALFSLRSVVAEESLWRELAMFGDVYTRNLLADSPVFATTSRDAPSTYGTTGPQATE